MTKAQRLIEIFNRKATELNLDVDVERASHGSYYIEVEAEDCFIRVIMGSRGRVKFISYSDPLRMYYSFERGKASFYQVCEFFKSVHRQRGIIAKNKAARAA